MSEKNSFKNNKQNTNLFSYNNNIKYSTHLNNSIKDITNNKNIPNKNKYHEKKLKINPIPEIEYLYNIPQKGFISTKKYQNFKKKCLLNFSSNEKNSTDIFINTNNNNKNKNNKLKRSQTCYEDMWKKIKEHEKDKINKFNNIKTELINLEISELRSYPHISKRSKYLARTKQRNSLYLSRSLNEERNLSFYFDNFYQKNKDDIFNKEKENLLNEREVKEKYDKFYRENIIWKRYKDESNEKIRYNNNIKKENAMNKKNTFRPLLNENTKRIVQKMSQNKELNLNQYNNLYNQTNERELLEKLRLQMKPVLSEVFDINNKKRPFISKKSYRLAKNSNEKNKRNQLNRNKTFNIIIPNKKAEKKENKKINSTKEENNKEIYDDYLRKTNYEYYLLQKFRELKNPFLKKKKELYKLNIREETAWNKEFVNNIMPKRKYGFIIEGLL